MAGENRTTPVMGLMSSMTTWRGQACLAIDPTLLWSIEPPTSPHKYPASSPPSSTPSASARTEHPAPYTEKMEAIKGEQIRTSHVCTYQHHFHTLLLPISQEGEARSVQCTESHGIKPPTDLIMADENLTPGLPAINTNYKNEPFCS